MLDRTVEVPCRTLAGVMHEFGLDRIDLLKVDIEGAELEVLAGVSPSLIRRVSQSTVEIHGAREFGFQLRDQVDRVIRRMEELGSTRLDFSRL